ncbi:MAG: heat-inducible transcriptional repressor HrcA [Clostridia bacterium]
MNNDNDKLGQRKHEILLSAIENFIRLECPITSQNVQETTKSTVSTATLRNELNALEAMGFLKQLHTSGGRVPTTKAYKYYVSFLMKDLKFDASMLMEVKDKVGKKTAGLSDIMSQVAKIVSEATSYPTVVLMHGFNNLEIEGIKIIPLIESQMLVLIKTKLGMIKKEITIEATDEECKSACEYLDNNFRGKSIGEMLSKISSVNSNLQNQLNSFQTVFNFLIAGLAQFASEQMKIEENGVSQMISDINPKNLEETKKVISAFEDKEAMKSVLEKKSDEEISFVFGDDEKSMDGCALIRAPIKLDGKEVATVGVFGPERLDYAKVASALKILSTELSSIKKQKGE